MVYPHDHARRVDRAFFFGIYLNVTDTRGAGVGGTPDCELAVPAIYMMIMNVYPFSLFTPYTQT